MTDIPPIVHLTLGILFVVVVVKGRKKIRAWWRRGCDRCRLEDTWQKDGWTHIAHTCFPWRNPYRDRKGRLWVFGRRVEEQERRAR